MPKIDKSRFGPDHLLNIANDIWGEEVEECGKGVPK